MPVLIDTHVLIRYFKEDEPLAEMIVTTRSTASGAGREVRIGSERRSRR